MYAIVRELPYDKNRLSTAGEQMAAFQRLHAAQAGYAGTLVIDVGDERRVVVNLWENEELALAARSTLEPHIQRLLLPLLRGEPRLVGVGTVVETDLARSA